MVPIQAAAVTAAIEIHCAGMTAPVEAGTRQQKSASGRCLPVLSGKVEVNEHLQYGRKQAFDSGIDDWLRLTHPGRS